MLIDVGLERKDAIENAGVQCYVVVVTERGLLAGEVLEEPVYLLNSDISPQDHLLLLLLLLLLDKGSIVLTGPHS